MVGPRARGIDLKQAVLRTGGMVDFWAWVTWVEWWTDINGSIVGIYVRTQRVSTLSTLRLVNLCSQWEWCDEVQLIQIALILISVL